MVDARTCGAAMSHTASLHGVVLPAWLQEIVQGEGRLTLTDYEAARLLGISRGSVREAIKSGSLAHVRLGHRLLIPVIPLLAMVGLEPPVADGS
jgi:excisionase family DNA binding protein